MHDRHLTVSSDRDSIVVSDCAGPVLRVRWFRNRWHWHERVFRLVMSEADELTPSGSMAAVELLVTELQQVSVDERRPLLFRVTVASESSLLPALRTVGFMVARHVFEPTLDPRAAVQSALELPDGAELLSLTAARRRFGDAALTGIYLAVYARCSRLDPATPERLTDAERADFLFSDEQLVVDLSCCAVLNGVPAGLVPVFQGAARHHFEFGPFGVTDSHLERYEEVTGGMLNWVFEASLNAPWLADQFTAEIDSDDPYILYACAALPFRAAAESVSLFFAPQWQR